MRLLLLITLVMVVEAGLLLEGRLEVLLYGVDPVSEDAVVLCLEEALRPSASLDSENALALGVVLGYPNTRLPMNSIGGRHFQANLL